MRALSGVKALGGNAGGGYGGCAKEVPRAQPVAERVRRTAP